MDNDQFERVGVSAPLYVFTITEPCYSCGQPLEIIALATSMLVNPEYDDPEAMAGEICLLSNVASLPPDILAAMQALYPHYQARFSQTAGQEYFMSVCLCGAHQGDYYVHKAMFKAACDAPGTIQVEQLPVQGQWEIFAGYSSSSAYDVIVERAE